MLEQLWIELTIAVYDAMAGIGEEREIGRAPLLLTLALHHLASAFDVVGTEGEDLSGLFQPLIEQVFQLTQLSGAGGSPEPAIENKDNILAAVL